MAEKSILCICLGNICRSPIAEAVFQKLINEKGLVNKWKVDSAALGGWHVGNSPDRRAMGILKKHGVPYEHRARQISRDDFKNFDFIFGMDDENMDELERLAPKDRKSELHLLGSFDPEGDRIIRDPYYDRGDAGFEKCYQQCLRSCAAFLDKHTR